MMALLAISEGSMTSLDFASDSPTTRLRCSSNALRWHWDDMLWKILNIGGWVTRRPARAWSGPNVQRMMSGMMEAATVITPTKPTHASSPSPSCWAPSMPAITVCICLHSSVPTASVCVGNCVYCKPHPSQLRPLSTVSIQPSGHELSVGGFCWSNNDAIVLSVFYCDTTCYVTYSSFNGECDMHDNAGIYKCHCCIVHTWAILILN